MELIICDRCKRWIVFSEEERGFSFKKARKEKSTRAKERGKCS